MKRPPVDFLIIGAQKAGTTAAAYNLNLHPMVEVFQGVTSFGQRELEFYNQHWDCGIDWYQSNFSYSKHLAGEKTAELLHRTICHERMAETAPNAKLLVFLRCPVERAYSQWKMASKPDRKETRTFAQVICDEMRMYAAPEYTENFYNCRNKSVPSWCEGYLLKGTYADQLEHLFKWFPRDRVHIAITEVVRFAMAKEYNRIFSFLGVEPFSGPFQERFASQNKEALDASLAASLAEYYRPHNARLFALLGYAVPQWRH